MAVPCQERDVEVVQSLHFVIFLRAALTEGDELEIFVEVAVAVRVCNELAELEAKLAGHAFRAQAENLERVCQHRILLVVIWIVFSEKHAQVVRVLDSKCDLHNLEGISGVQFLKSDEFALDLGVFGRSLQVQHIVAFLAQILQHRGELADQDATFAPNRKVRLILVNNYPARVELQ